MQERSGNQVLECSTARPSANPTRCRSYPRNSGIHGNLPQGNHGTSIDRGGDGRPHNGDDLAQRTSRACSNGPPAREEVRCHSPGP
jgi:hypothetical protein